MGGRKGVKEDCKAKKSEKVTGCKLRVTDSRACMTAGFEHALGEDLGVWLNVFALSGSQ